MPSGTRMVVIHRAHFTCVPGRGGFWPGQFISSHWRRFLFPLVWVACGQSALAKFSPTSLHPTIYSDLVNVFLSPFCTPLLCKIKLQPMRVVDIIKSIHIRVYMWSGRWLPLMTMMGPQLCHGTALKICAVLPWSCGLFFFFFLCEWVHCAVLLGTNQCILEWSLANGQGYEPRPLISAVNPGFLSQPCAGTHSADLTSCNANTKPSYLFDCQLEYASFLS